MTCSTTCVPLHEFKSEFVTLVSLKVPSGCARACLAVSSLRICISIQENFRPQTSHPGMSEWMNEWIKEKKPKKARRKHYVLIHMRSKDTHCSPTNNAPLINFFLSSDAKILLISTDWARKSAPKRAKMCMRRARVPTELPFCRPPLVVGRPFKPRKKGLSPLFFFGSMSAIFTTASVQGQMSEKGELSEMCCAHPPTSNPSFYKQQIHPCTGGDKKRFFFCCFQEREREQCNM